MTRLAYLPLLNLLWLLVLLAEYQITGAVEYCWEDFNATCPEDEVVLMQTALYGRMKRGRCLTSDYKVGCYKDAIYHFDKVCSGRHSCIIPIPDTSLQKEVPCPRDLVAYLNASYTCVKAAKPKGEVTSYCSPKDTFIESKENGYISSLISMETLAGTKSCPWVISVPKGQTINITLLDFSVNEHDSTPMDVCVMYAILREHGESSTDITLCGGEVKTKVVYLSDSNILEIEINSALKQSGQNMPYFLLKYQVVGCPDIPAPSGGWLERRDQKMTMGCNDTGDIRHLVCNGESWVGTLSNCSGASQTHNPDGPGFVRKEVPFGLVLAIIIGVILGIIIGSLLLGIVLYTQNKLKVRRQQTQLTTTAGMTDQEKTQILQSGNYGYAHVWELQQLRSGSEGADPRNLQAVTTCPSEFGTHLRKPPGFQGSPGNAKDHPYESPRFQVAGGHSHVHNHSPRHHPESGVTLVPKCHEFDLHIKTTVAGNANHPNQQRPAEENTEARYTD